MEYRCAFCGEENERPNLITLIFDDEGDAEIEVTQE